MFTEIVAWNRGARVATAAGSYADAVETSPFVVPSIAHACFLTGHAQQCSFLKTPRVLMVLTVATCDVHDNDRGLSMSVTINEIDEASRRIAAAMMIGDETVH